jgi:hypothetical protein
VCFFLQFYQLVELLPLSINFLLQKYKRLVFHIPFSNILFRDEEMHHIKIFAVNEHDFLKAPVLEYIKPYLDDRAGCDPLVYDNSSDGKFLKNIKKKFPQSTPVEKWTIGDLGSLGAIINIIQKNGDDTVYGLIKHFLRDNERGVDYGSELKQRTSRPLSTLKLGRGSLS